jgi:hypothetical protein
VFIDLWRLTMHSDSNEFDTTRALSSRRRFLTTASGSVAAASFGGLGLLTLPSASAAGAVQTRPIADFLSTQGTFCVPDGFGGCLLFVPPAPNFIGWSTIFAGQTHVLFAGVDYAGLANTFLGNPFGTTVDGTVIERPLADGRAEVRVLLFTENANTWVIDLDLAGDVLAQIAGKPTLFGRRPQDGGAHALGKSTFEVRFINSAPGAALPDLVQVFNVPDAGPAVLEFVGFTSQANGPLTAQFGVVEGTPGRCMIRQTGLNATYLKAGPKSRVALDAYPAELIELRPVGR